MTTTDPAPATAAPAAPPWRVLPVLLAVALAVGAGLLIGPRAPELGPADSGDPAIAAAARQAAGDPTGFDTLAVAAGDERTAGLGGADGATAFELGSIAKTLTGMLLADLVEDGVVTPDDTLADLLPGVAFRDPDTAATTLEQLATQRSGLPRDVPTPFLRRYTQAMGNDPFGELSPRAVLDAVAAAEVGPREPGYSNFGFAVLGHALAERTGTPYPDLLRHRILTPLGMTATVVVEPGEPLPGEPGRTENGTPVQAWRGWGYAPAGGAIWSTTADLGRLLDGVATGSAPGASADEPRTEHTDDRRIGYAWITSSYPTATGERTITWHNGATTGFRTWAGFDRDTGKRVAVASSTSRSVDDLGLRLLGIERDGGHVEWFLIAATLFGLWLAAVSVASMLPPWRRTARATPDRLFIPGAVAQAMLVLWFVHLVGAWHAVPSLLWTAALIAAAVGLARVVAWWPHLPVVAGDRTRRIWATAGSLAAWSAVAALLLWATA